MRALLNVLIILTILAAVVSLWGFRATSQHANPTVQARLESGEGQLSTVGEPRRRLPVDFALGEGDGVDLSDKAVLFLAFPDGGAGRLLGPASLTVLETEHSVSSPAPLSSLLSDDDSVSKVKTTLVLRLDSGEFEVEAGPPASVDSIFEIRGPTVLVRARDDVLRVTIRPEGESSVEVTKGSARVALVAEGRSGAVPLVIPEMPSVQGILVRPVPPSEGRDAAFLAATEALSEREPIRSGDFEFQRGRGAEFPFWVGYRAGGAPSTVALLKLPVRPIPSQLIGGLTTDVWTNESIEANLPPGVSVRIRAGNVADVEIAGVDYAAVAELENGRLRISGLPLGIDVGRFLTDLPHIVRLTTEEGIARVQYLEDVPPPELDSGVPRALPHSSEYFASIKTPREINTDWRVLSTNAGLAGLTAAMVLLLAAFAGELLEEGEGLLGKLAGRLRRLAGGRRYRRIRANGLTNGLLLIVLFGVIYSFNADPQGFMSPDGLFIFSSMAIGVGMVSLAEPYFQSFWARRHNLPFRARLFPGNMLFAVGSAGITRIAGLEPGLIFGVPGGNELEEGREIEPRQRVILAAIGFGGLAALGLTTWGLTAVIPTLTVFEAGRTILEVMGGLASKVQDILLLTFLAAVEAMMFALLPVGERSGRAFLRFSRPLWFALFVVTAFFFWHVVLNPNADAGETLSANIAIFIIASSAAVLGVYVLVWLKERRNQR